MTEYIHIRNWDKHQHRDVTRNKTSPPRWIMDWVAQLDDDDHRQLSQAQKGILQGLRLMYAARRGRGTDEAQAKHQLCTNKAEARHWRSNLEALNHAGFILLSASKLRADSRQNVRLEETKTKTEEQQPDEDQNQHHPSDEARPEGPTPEMINNLIETTASGIKDIPW